MSYEHIATIITALERYRGDDAERARRAFRYLNADEMQREYNLSGRTYADYLASCEAHEARVNAAIEWVKTLP